MIEQYAAFAVSILDNVQTSLGFYVTFCATVIY